MIEGEKTPHFKHFSKIKLNQLLNLLIIKKNHIVSFKNPEGNDMCEKL